jgi:hypothetical protein
MALDSSLVDVAVTGTVSYAPTSAAAPTNSTTALDAAFDDVGYISEDGVVETRDRSTNNIIAWQNADVVRTVTTESSITVQFTMIETNRNSLELFYGTAVTGVAPLGAINITPSDSGGRKSIVVDYVDGTKFVRLYLPEAEVTEVGELTLASGDPVGYEVTITGYPVAAGYSAQKFWSELEAEV